MDVSILKIGGSCISSFKDVGDIISKIAKRIIDGEHFVLVVSALKGTTDKLLEEARIKDIAKPEDLDNYLAKGEIESSRLVFEQLLSEGISVALVEPYSESWPIVTDDCYGSANPIISETRERVDQTLVPLINRGVTPIICGFIGKTKDGKLTTLGRGGSDLTAVLLGRVLEAKEVILIKDVDGLYTSDPKKADDARPLSLVSAEEALRMAEQGAKVIQPKALRIKTKELSLRIVGKLSGKGTVVMGCIE